MSRLPNRFWSKVKTRGDDDCWVWTASTFGKKPYLYGSFKLDGHRQKAHRVSWILSRGKIPRGLNVLHKCDNPLCVNPNHLFLGTFLDNTIDMIRKGRRAPLPKGEESPMAVLSEAGVRSIKDDYSSGNCSQQELALLYGVSQSHISRIVRGVRWSHVA